MSQEFVVQFDETNDHLVTIWYNKPLIKRPDDQPGIHRLVTSLMDVDGFDGLSNASRYSIQFFIAKTFDPNEVVSEVQSLIRRLSVDIIVPNGGSSSKIITGEDIRGC